MIQHPHLHLLVNSAERDNVDETPCNFTANLSRSVDANQTMSSCVVSASVMNLFFNIYAPFNNGFLSIAGEVGFLPTIVQFTIPEGRYDYLTFAQAIKDYLITELGLALATVTVSPTTGKMSISFGFVTVTNVSLIGVESIRNGDLNNASLYSNPVQPIVTDHLYNLNYYMGGHNTYSSIIVAGPAVGLTPVVLPNTINLSGVTKVLILSEELASSNAIHSQGSTINYLASIDLSRTPYGSIASTRTTDHMLGHVAYVDSRSLTTVRFQLTDESYNILRLPENANVTMDIQLHKYDVG